MTEIPGVSSNGVSQATEKFGVMLCGHGSRDAGAVAEFANLADQLRARFEWPVEYGYLEFATPIIREGLEKLSTAGARHILAVPGMLFAAGHAKNDIPSVLNTWAASRPGLKIEYGRDLGIDPKMIAAAGARIREALDAAPEVSAHETLLVVVGRGASDPDANSNVAKVTRLLWEGFGFGWAETAYSGVTFPLVEPALEKAARLGFRRIIVFPYFLFTGILVDRIYAMTDAVAARHPQIEFLKAGYLNDHPLVLDTFVERVHEILQGQNLMNCQMCKYRAQVLGFEAEVGLPQESHHHHVEGIIGSAGDPPPSPTGEDHAHPHPHAHHHHADHSHPHPHPHSEPPPPLWGRVGEGAVKDGQDVGSRHTHSHHGPGGGSGDPHPSPPPQGGRESAHPHDHAHGNPHHHGDHPHTHHPYPHADHPLGPRSMRRK